MNHPKLIESIRIEDGQYYNLSYHEARMQSSIAALGIAHCSLRLTEFLKHISVPQKGIWKCRVLYAERIISIAFKPYKAKKIKSLKIVHHNTIDYTHKLDNRASLDQLYAQRGACDDIIIVKNTLLTDSYYGNLLLWKEGAWFTPESYLLAGTQRASLLANKGIQAIPIGLDDLKSFEKVKIINAMLDLEQGPEVRIGDVVV